MRALMVCVVVLSSSAAAFAQSPNPLLTSASVAKDLDFPSKVSRLGLLSAPEMAIYKPEGSGPFPALILLHQCGGLAQGNWQNTAIRPPRGAGMRDQDLRSAKCVVEECAGIFLRSELAPDGRCPECVRKGLVSQRVEQQ